MGLLVKPAQDLGLGCGPTCVQGILGTRGSQGKASIRVPLLEALEALGFPSAGLRAEGQLQVVEAWGLCLPRPKSFVRNRLCSSLFCSAC